MLAILLAVLTQLSDTELVARFKGGDEHAFSHIVRRYQDRVFGLCFRWLGERAMADFAAARAHDAPCFTRAERREVVVQVELLGVFGHEAVDDLLVLDCAQHACHKTLRLAALEEG